MVRPRSDPHWLALRLLDILVMLFAAMAVALRPILPAQGVEEDTWVQMCVFVATMAWAVGMALRQRLRLARTGVGMPLLALLAIAAVSTLRSPHPGASVDTLLEWVSYAALFFLLVNVAGERLDRGLVLRLLWASAFVVILYGLLQQFVNLRLICEQIDADPERVQRELGLSADLISDLRERARRRIFSTFLQPNAFAAFLVLLVPGFVGHGLDRLLAGHRGKRFLVAAVLWVGGALACLLLTYSKGGWLVFGLSSAVFVAMLGSRLLRRYWRHVALAAAVGVAGASVLFATGLAPVKIFRDVAGSFGVRVGYWRTAVAMAEDNPVAGVGLGTFADHYARYRWLTARVTRAAHNDYLQVAAELGIVGLVAFLAVWAAWFRGALARPARGASGWQFARRANCDPAHAAIPLRVGGRRPAPAAGKRAPPSAEPLTKWLGYAAGILAFALANTVTKAFEFGGWGDEPWWHGYKPLADFGLVLALGAAWLLFFAALRGGTPVGPGSLCHKGLVCGVVGFLLHCLVDFDYCVPGVAFTAWAVAALSVARRRRLLECRLPPVPAFCVGVGAVLVMIGFQYRLTRTVRAGIEHAEARALAAESLAPDPKEPRDELLREARQHYDLALSLNTLDDTMRIDYGDLLASHFSRPEGGDRRLFAQAVDLYVQAAELNRASAKPHLRLARLCRAAADAGWRELLLPLVQRGCPDYPARRSPAYIPAIAAYEAAIARDPNTPVLLLEYATALEAWGDLAAARANVARALELHKIVLAKHPEHVLRLRDGELAHAKALRARLDAIRDP